MWIHENGTGLRVTATVEDAREMVKKDATHSVLWPRGTEAQEAEEFAKREKHDLSLIPEKQEAKVEEQNGQAVEVHHARRRHQVDKE